MTASLFENAKLAVPADAPARRLPAPWIRFWLWGVALLVILMVVVGGATRLTGSGLSITQWRPVTGALPPLSAADWSAEFARYRGSPQYEFLNAGMSLADFKSIYWWEWGHRQLGRFIGLVYLGGFLFGLVRRAFPFGTGIRLALMGALLGFQGLIGWVMVASGLKPGMTAVEPLDLSAHLLFASLFLASVVAMATSLERRAESSPGPRLAGPIPASASWLSKLLLCLIFVQITLGALVAGAHAGLIYNSWPLMDGRFIPPLRELFAESPWFANLFENASLIQLDHRLVAYLVGALALANAALWRRGSDGRLAGLAAALAGLVLAQLVLGIVTLLLAVPLLAALAHQLLAMVVLTLVVRLATLCRSSHRRLGPAALYEGKGPLAAHVATR
jgi:cytochrome c oxidase assembly protein subunit 15